MMSGDPGFTWPEVRGYAQEFFTYWPDGEDLLWAKKVYAIIETGVNFGIGQDGVDGHTRSVLHALSVLYAESATRLGLPQFESRDHLERIWITVYYGSETNFDEVLWDVGSALRSEYAADAFLRGLLLPLLGSLVTGAGYCHEGPDLVTYLNNVSENGFDLTRFREDEFYRFWAGGHYQQKALECLS